MQWKTITDFIADLRGKYRPAAALYLLICIMLALFYFSPAKRALFSEGGVVETMQVLLFLLAGAIFLSAYFRKNRKERHLLIFGIVSLAIAMDEVNWLLPAAGFEFPVIEGESIDAVHDIPYILGLNGIAIFALFLIIAIAAPLFRNKFSGLWKILKKSEAGFFAMGLFFLAFSQGLDPFHVEALEESMELFAAISVMIAALFSWVGK